VAFHYHTHLPPIKTGSAPGAPTVTLSTLVILSPPPEPPQPPLPVKPAPPVPPAPSVSEVPVTPPPPSPPEPITQPEPAEQGVPVLAAQPIKVDQDKPAKIQSAKPSPPTHSAASPAAAVTSENHPKPTATRAFASSYAPGASDLPHPPYPDEARNLRETGTVVVNVQFDAGGGVAQTEVTQSSGVPLLDSNTRSFIRTHWHSPAYAGQTVSVPVEYKLQNL